MDPILEDLIRLLELERIEDNIYRGQSRDIGSAQVFGGQVLGQALTAASYTVEKRDVHSLHAYFLRRGDMQAPIVYEVDRARDGGSFSNRRVVAIQHGRPIFNMAASFQVAESGLEHQFRMPQVAGPDGLPDVTDIPAAELAQIPAKMHRFLTAKRPFEFRLVEPMDLSVPRRAAPFQYLWLKTVDALPEDPDLHRNILAYVSDYQLLSTATAPHGIRFGVDDVRMASLDHAMWFHRPFRVDEWMLYSMDGPSASGARGLARGQFFTADGTMVASTTQEGLVRVRDRDAD